MDTGRLGAGSARTLPVSNWPTTLLRSVPDHSVAVELALTIRRATLPPSDAEAAPVDLRAVCAMGRFDARVQPLGADRGGAEAYLVPERVGRFRVLVDPIPRNTASDFAEPPHISPLTYRARARFRVSHEIGHSFFYDTRRPLPERRSPWTEQEETFCDVFASALLVPPQQVAEQAPAAHSIIALARRFATSLQVVAFTAVRVWAGGATVIALMRRTNPRSLVTAHRVVWGISSTGHFIPKGARFEPPSVLEAADRGSAMGHVDSPRRWLAGSFHLDAATTGRRDLVLCVLRPEGAHHTTPPESPTGSQATLFPC
jgi:hypothetical protein